MLTRPQTAVYKCIIPVKTRLITPSTIYHSLFRRPKRRIPFPAWPEVDDPYQPCCLPTLMRAVYFLNRGTRIELKKAATRAEKYLSQMEDIEPEIREQAIALIKAQQSFSHHLSKVTDQPPVLFGVHHLSLPESVTYQAKVFEVLMQGLIYGHRSNFYGDEDAYADAHEYAHHHARVFYSGVVLDELAKSVHATLCRLAGDESLSREEIAKLWARFWETNTHMSDLAKKFEPLEEIYATYMGLRFCPIEVRNKVKARIKKELSKRKWYKAYEAFAEACDNSNSPAWVAFFLFEPVCRMLEKIDMDGAKLLEKFLEVQDVIWMIYALEGVIEQECDLNEDELEYVEKSASLLEQGGIPREVFASVCEAMCDIVIPKIRRLAEANIKNDFSDVEYTDLPSAQHVTLIGYQADKYILPVIIHEEQEYKGNISNPAIRLVFESLRQQLSQDCSEEGNNEKRHKIVCPYAYQKPCCGLKADLQRLHERLPEEDKKHFEPPNCDLVR